MISSLLSVWPRFFGLRGLSCLLAIILSLLVHSNAYSGQVTLVWTPNTEPDLAGYKLHYGIASRDYHLCIDVGNECTWTLSNLEEGES